MGTSTQAASVRSLERYEALLTATAAIAAFRDCESFERLFAGELRRVTSFDYLNFLIFDETDCTVEWRREDDHLSALADTQRAFA